ncbi:MAG: heparinase II/III family protein, partial [Kiritimatiellia bacterium]
ALYRINTLAMDYRLHGRAEVLARALDELRAVCAFSDWNPSHFLDVAEMSLAVATGYDWLYEYMDEATRREIAAGLRRNGLEAGNKSQWWIRANNNWGQVCHAGILAAALALAEENPDETARLVQRCVDFIPYSMKALAPNGNYPEGPGYWNYGIEFNVAAMMLLEGTLGSDFGLMSQPGFKETAQYLDLVTGPSGMTFNYADGGSGRGACFATWWFARRLNRPDLLAYFEREAFRRYCTARRTHKGKTTFAHGNDRMFAYGLFCVQTPPADLKPNLPLVWDAGGPVPITVQRSSWDDATAMFVGLKGGSPSSNHGHMDGGSFILEARGVRWAIDLGAENYHKIESLGMNLWSMAQNSDRWRVYRLGTSSHNELMLDGCPQSVKGFAKVREVKAAAPTSVELDLTSLYTNATQVLRRGVMAADGGSYELTDVVRGLRAGAPIRWAMVTRATPEIKGADLVLRQQGKTLRLAQTGAQVGAWAVAPAAGPNTWDSANKGCSQITFTVPMPAEGEARLGVAFTVE